MHVSTRWYKRTFSTGKKVYTKTNQSHADKKHLHRTHDDFPLRIKDLVTTIFKATTSCIQAKSNFIENGLINASIWWSKLIELFRSNSANNINLPLTKRCFLCILPRIYKDNNFKHMKHTITFTLSNTYFSPLFSILSFQPHFLNFWASCRFTHYG